MIDAELNSATDGVSSGGVTVPVSRRLTAQPLHRGVVEQVARWIVGGELPPGASLPIEADLAKRFGVSRTVIREAVRVLVAKGLLAVRHGSGMWVQGPDAWDHLDPLVLFEQVRGGQGEGVLDEVLEVRCILEVEAAALAAERRTGDDLAALRTSLAAMAGAVVDPDSYTELDIRFHNEILAAARNRLLREALRPVTETLRAGRVLTTRLSGGAAASLRGHEEIQVAIERSDTDAAREAMRRHVRQFERDIRRSLRPADADGSFHDRGGETS